MPLEPTVLSWLALVSLVLACFAVLVAVAAWRRAGRRVTSASRVGSTRRSKPHRPNTPMSSQEVTEQIDVLKGVAASALRHLAVVRYDAFGDMGGHLSWSMALLDDGGDGVVLTAIHGRSDSRTYAKNVAAWTANQQLSPEEEEAIEFARASTE